MIGVMAGPQTSRPIAPKPETFGLSANRAKRLETPFDPGWKFWLPYAAAILYALINYGPPPGGIGLILWLAWPITAFVAISIPMGAGLIWARLQPDYPAYLKYKVAGDQYRIAFSVWERQQRDWWRRLDGRSFEVEAGAVFARRGYVVRRTGGAGDQGIDLLLTKDGVTIAVQCKAHRLPVGPGPVRDLYGSMVHHNHREAWLLSTTGFTKGARAFASGKRIKLLTVDDLL